MKRLRLLSLLLLISPTAFGVSREDYPPEISSWLQANADTRQGHDTPFLLLAPVENNPGAVALYRGQTDHLLYVAAFRLASERYVFCCLRKIGGKSANVGLTYESFSVSGVDGTIELTGRHLLSATQSERYSVRYKVVNNELVEVGPSNQRLERPDTK